MPRHPHDNILKEFLEDRARAEVVEDIGRRIDSHPPSAGLTSARERLIERVGTSTGSYDIRALESEVRGLVVRATAEKLTEEREKRLAAEKALADRVERDAAFWRGIVGSVLAACIIGVIGWVAWTLLAARGAH